MKFSRACLLWSGLLVLSAAAAPAADPWIITGEVVLTEPAEVGDVIIVGGGSLTVRDVPEPGLQVEGNVWVIGDGRLRLEGSAIRFLSTYHGQYALVGIDDARIEVMGCDYRIPSRVQHGLVIGGEAELMVEDTDFDDVQLVASDTSHLQARRLNGSFEVIVQNDARMELADIPRDPDAGRLWVWVEFPSGSVAEYSPPMPGSIDYWTFPPAGAVGIRQSVIMERCEALLWPMLVRDGSRLTLRDIAEDNWVVVGLHMPISATVVGMQNGVLHEDTILGLSDRELRLVDSSIDTWNLYPEEEAVVKIRDSLLGEILSFQNSRVRMERTTIDGSGGFFGARDGSHIRAFDCSFTTTIEAAQDSTIELHSCDVRPYPSDPTGAFTRFGAHDNARLLADHTPVETTPVLGGDGLIAVTVIADPPVAPPPSGAPAVLHGWAAIFSEEDGPALKSWRFDVVPRLGGRPLTLADGEENVEENGELGVWAAEEPGADHLLRIMLTDNRGRTLTGYHWVFGPGPRQREVRGRRRP